MTYPQNPFQHCCLYAPVGKPFSKWLQLKLFSLSSFFLRWGRVVGLLHYYLPFPSAASSSRIDIHHNQVIVAY